MKKPRKLIEVRFVPAMGEHRCYTCVYHDANSLKLASVCREKEYADGVQKTYFCMDHASDVRERWDSMEQI